jgi:hypothetical protein
MQHVATREFLWDADLDTTHDGASDLPAVRGRERFGLVRGLAWGAVFSVPIWAGVGLAILR